ncbi:MAG: FAD-dependent oxidoreductase [Proteobacteria bacterium ST_bin11]|jgi:predicted NAD/FAD-binding protein|nr:MAG: FAD-dependent oxidoreductase [Proteobacteria bacterium ST_bin11]
MKIAIIGSGISGLTAAYYLHKDHAITVFEERGQVGGHTDTHTIELAGKDWQVDTGFIVFNDWTYPNFIRLIDELGVTWQDSKMSFSVKCERSGLEYKGGDLNGLFAQRRNLLSPTFIKMIADILRFNKQAVQWLASGDDETTLSGYLATQGFSEAFKQHYIIPMGAAIWSASEADMLRFPARYFLRFFQNHGMLQVRNRPVWRVIQGGSSSYLAPLIKGFKENIRLNSPIESVSRDSQGVLLKPQACETERFDAVIFACHSDQALRLLADANSQEQAILGAIPYQENIAILHTDTSILPASPRAWAAWNYHVLPQARDCVALTYNMNILQSLPAPETFCVTLNYPEAIDPKRIIKQLVYHHPQFSLQGVAAQQRHAEISGVNHTYYCGAYWGFGFHEDGVRSALNVVEQIRHG